jgi:hypothetical protein
VNDQLFVAGGGYDAILNVDTIDGSGGITGVSIVNAGISYEIETAYLLEGGNGSGGEYTVDTIQYDQFNLSKASGTVVCDYLDLTDSNATGGASWYAGDHSVNEGNNSGWIWGVLLEEAVGAGSEGLNVCSKNLIETIFAVPVFDRAWTLGREYTETLQVASLRLGQTAKTFIEALVTIDDTIQNVFTGVKVFIQSIVVAPAITTVATLARTLTETINAVSKLASSTSRTFIEALTAAGNIVNQTARTFAETIKATPIFASVGTFAKTLTESVQVISEKLYQASRTLIEHLNIVPALTRVLTAAQTLTETIKMTSQKLFSLSKTLIETVQIVGQKFYQVSRTLIESFNISSAKIIAGAKTLVESIVIAPVFAALGTFAKVLSETIRVVSALIGQTATVFSEALTVTSSTIKATGRILIEAITIGAQNLFATSRTFIETLVVAPIYSKVLTAYKTLVESIVAVSQLANQTGKIFSERLIVVSGFVSAISRIFIEIINATDNIVRSTGRTFVNAIRISGNTIFSTARTLVENLTVSPVIEKIFTGFKVLLEAVQVGSQKLFEMARLFTETITAASAKILATGKVLTDSVRAVSQITFGLSRTFVESILVKSFKLTYRAFVYTESLAVRGFLGSFSVGKLLIERILGRTWFEFGKTQFIELTDHLQVGMNFIKRTARIFTETIKMAADVIIKYIGRTFEEVVYVAKKNGEYLGLLFGRVLKESFITTGALGEWVIGKLLPETIKVFGNIVNAIARVFVETLILVGNVFAQTARIFTEIINAVDNYARTWTISRILTQSVRIADLTRFRKTQYKVLIDHLNAAGTLLRAAGKRLQESLTAAGAIGSWAIGKLIIQAINVGDSLKTGGTRVFTETLVVLDNIVLSTGKLLLESVKAISSMGSWVIGKLFIQPIKVFASTINTWTLSRLFTETINAAGNMVSKAAKTFVETVRVAGTFVLGTISILFTETVNVVASYLKTWTLSRVFTESITAIGSIVRQTGRVFTQTVKVTGQFVLGTISKLLNETINIFEIVSKALPAKVYSETIRVADTVFTAFVRVLVESVKVSGQFVLGTISKVLIEIVNVAETFLRTWTLSRVLTETINVVDSIFSTFVKILYEALQVGGSIVFTAGKLLLEAFNVSGAVIRAISRTFIETINAVDQAVNAAFVRIFTEIVGVSHLTTSFLGRTLTETIVLKWTRAKFFLNGVMVGLWTKVARVTNGIWQKINRKNN